MKRFLVVDVGDPSVGLQSSLAVDLAVSDEMAELMEGQKTKEEFKKDLINLTEKYFASETFYDVVESLN